MLAVRRWLPAGGLPPLVSACHPEPSAAVTAVAAGLAMSVGRGAAALLVAAAFLAGQLSIGWSNDWLDAARDRASGRPDKPTVGDRVAPATLRRAALAAATVCLPLSLAMGWAAGLAHLLAVAMGWAYNLGLKGTALSWLPYAVAFGLLPSVVTLGLPGSPWAPWWAGLAGVLLGVGAHLANALPDLDADERTGVHGLPHRIGGPASRAGAGVLLLTATAVLVLAPGRRTAGGVLALAASAVLTIAGLAASARPGSRAAFRATMAVALLDVGLLLVQGTRLA